MTGKPVVAQSSTSPCDQQVSKVVKEILRAMIIKNCAAFYPTLADCVFQSGSKSQPGEGEKTKGKEKKRSNRKKEISRFGCHARFFMADLLLRGQEQRWGRKEEVEEGGKLTTRVASGGLEGFEELFVETGHADGSLQLEYCVDVHTTFSFFFFSPFNTFRSNLEVAGWVGCANPVGGGIARDDDVTPVVRGNRAKVASELENRSWLTPFNLSYTFCLMRENKQAHKRHR